MIIIDPGKMDNEYTLPISKYIYKRLNELGISSILINEQGDNLSEDERIKLINNLTSDKDIALINLMSTGDLEGTEIVYALRNNDKLSNLINNNLNSINRVVNKYYQKRDESDTSKDYNTIIRDTSPIETIIIKYGYIDNYDDVQKISNNYLSYAEMIVKSLLEYLNKPYLKGESTYIVQKGDSLYSIAKKYGITVDKLKELNNLKSNLINIGQVLFVTSSNTYIVQKGDSLYSIAKKYGITVDKLKELNDLKSNLINIGQVLIVTSSNTYIVQKGDSLYSISKKYGITVDKLKELNNLKSNIINIGQILKIPS